ncbi:MAG: right-handed parallel beta-helix repeat-containing protein [Luteolibacter sp.]
MNSKISTLAVLVLAGAALPLPAKDYYIAPDGKDTNAGSLTAPFATIQRSQKSVGPGDTVFIRGGTYKMTEAQITSRQRNRALVNVFAKSGKPDRPINYFAYQNELPVFDLSDVKPNGMRVTAFHVSGSANHLKGISITGVQVTITGHTQSICVDNEGDDNTYEALQMHDGQAIGFWLGRGSNNLVLNCDAYRNYDYTSENKRGGNVDGFGFHVPVGSVKNVFRGCRSWFNSDDGFDLITTHEPLLIENCWSFYNGYDPSFKSLGDGNGFKLGGYGVNGGELPPVIPRHVIRDSLAVHNKASGFYANHQPGGLDLFNNTAYLNNTNFNLLGRNAAHTEDVPGYGHKLKNNLGYKGRTEIANINEALCDIGDNYFSLKLKFNDKDFESLDEADLVKPRKPDGSLPDIQLMHLKAGNPAIDKGVDVGLLFSGKAPDLGAFERGKPR